MKEFSIPLKKDYQRPVIELYNLPTLIDTGSVIPVFSIFPTTIEKILTGLENNNRSVLNLYSSLKSPIVKIGIEKGFSREAAIDLAIEQAIGENLLDGYFAAHKAEVKGMILPCNECSKF